MVLEKVKLGEEYEALISGCEAIAVALSLADVDVVTGYPIRPYDTVINYIARLIADGEMDTDLIQPRENTPSLRLSSTPVLPEPGYSPAPAVSAGSSPWNQWSPRRQHASR